MIYRAIFRHILIKALQNATIAGKEVYDQPLNDFLLSVDHSIEAKPRIGVYIRDQEINLGSSIFNPCAFKHELKCRVEIELAVFGADLSEQEGVLTVLSQNDRYLALKMDVLEQQVYDVFYKNSSYDSNNLREKIAKITRYNSISEYVRDQIDKIAMRTIQVDLDLNDYIESGFYDDVAGSLIIDRYQDKDVQVLQECSVIGGWLNSIKNSINNQSDDTEFLDIEINSNLNTDQKTPNNLIKVDFND